MKLSLRQKTLKQKTLRQKTLKQKTLKQQALRHKTLRILRRKRWQRRRRERRQLWKLCFLVSSSTSELTEELVEKLTKKLIEKLTKKLTKRLTKRLTKKLRYLIKYSNQSLWLTKSLNAADIIDELHQKSESRHVKLAHYGRTSESLDRLNWSIVGIVQKGGRRRRWRRGRRRGDHNHGGSSSSSKGRKGTSISLSNSRWFRWSKSQTGLAEWLGCRSFPGTSDSRRSSSRRRTSGPSGPSGGHGRWV